MIFLILASLFSSISEAADIRVRKRDLLCSAASSFTDAHWIGICLRFDLSSSLHISRISLIRFFYDTNPAFAFPMRVGVLHRFACNFLRGVLDIFLLSRIHICLFQSFFVSDQVRANGSSTYFLHVSGPVQCSPHLVCCTKTTNLKFQS